MEMENRKVLLLHIKAPTWNEARVLGKYWYLSCCCIVPLLETLVLVYREDKVEAWERDNCIITKQMPT